MKKQKQAPHQLNDEAKELLQSFNLCALQDLLNEIIKSKAWRKLHVPFDNFGEYALNKDGLHVNSNQKLWLLRCSLDFDGKHIKEWKDVLLTVGRIVKNKLGNEGITIDNSMPSLEHLARVSKPENGITYYPIRASGHDRDILLLLGKRAGAGKYISEIANGKTTRKEALIDSGLVTQEVRKTYICKCSHTKILGRDGLKIYCKDCSSDFSIKKGNVCQK